MTEKEFLEVVSLHVETYYLPEGFSLGRRVWNTPVRCGWQLRSGEKLKDINLDDAIFREWEMGSMWKMNTSTWELDTILAEVCPQITLEQLNCLLTKCKPDLVEYDEYQIHKDGGWIRPTSMQIQFVKLRRLYERLQGLGLI